ncbi:MAG: acetate--CoA ligase family protein [Burkholderiales bacterium]
MNPGIEALLRPKSIAILGASADFQKLNGRTLKALLDKGYAGQIYPVNPKYGHIGDLRCYDDVADLPDGIDLAIIAVPARHVPRTLRVLGERKVSAAIVFSSGFSEVGGGGVKLEEELRAAIKESGVRVLGPNCLGLINAFENVMATFSQFSLGPTPPGPAAFVTQSGALGTATAGSARRRGLNFGYFVNTGNETDVTFVDIMRAVVTDPNIQVGAGYIEGLKDGRGLLEVAEEALQLGKPLVLMKVGRTQAGAKAIASHTGSLAGEDAVFDGVIRAKGIVRARSDEQLLDIVDIAAHCSLPQGRGIGFVTRSGGAGALMADRAEELGLNVATLTEETTAKLKEVVPIFGATSNPVDITAQGLVDPSIMRESLKILLSDPNVDIAAVWLAFTEKHADITVQTFAEAKAQTNKPFVVSWVGIPDAALVKMREHGIAVLRGAEPAVDAIAALVGYAEARRNWLADKAPRNSMTLPQLTLPHTAGTVSSIAARALLEEAGVPTLPAELVTSAGEAVAAAEKFGFPVALKIESPDILHKTEANGVKLGLRDPDAVRWAYQSVIDNARRYKRDPRIDGVLVQPMAQGDVELVVGLKHDSNFGVVIMVGLGGIHIEVLKDVVFRKAPVTLAEADRMLNELKSKALLEGVRGHPPIDREALVRMISAVSRFGAAAGHRLVELDLNPVLCAPGGIAAVDWLMVLNQP